MSIRDPGKSWAPDLTRCLVAARTQGKVIVFIDECARIPPSAWEALEAHLAASHLPSASTSALADALHRFVEAQRPPSAIAASPARRDHLEAARRASQHHQAQATQRLRQGRPRNMR